MRLTLFILFTLLACLAEAQTGNPNSIAYSYETMAQAIKTPKKRNWKVTVAEKGIGGTFTVKLRSEGFIPDTAIIYRMADTSLVLVRDTSHGPVKNASWWGLKGDSITDNYNQMQRMVAWVNRRGGNVTINFDPGIYLIDTFKMGFPILKTVIVHDTVIVTNPDDGSTTSEDTTYEITTDSLTKVTTKVVLNTIDDISFIGVENVKLVGNGATINVRGNFNREWTHTNTTGRGHYSAYNTVIPLEFRRSKNIWVEGFQLDGNCDQMTKDTLITEGDDYGLVFRACENVTVKNIYIHNFATDGLYFEGLAGTLKKASRYVNVDNVKVWYCGRQGLTIGGLFHGIFTNCDFSKTGMKEGLGTYPGHAPKKGLDIEPIFDFPSRTDVYTSEIVFDNCVFEGNTGGAIAISHPQTVRNIYFRNCTVDNSVDNHLYAIINSAPNITFENCDILTGRGGIFLTRGTGKNQRMVFKNNYITAGGQLFLSGTGAQFGAIIEGNFIMGKHDTAWNDYFPYIGSAATVRNNTFVIDSNLYKGPGPKRGFLQNVTVAEGNTWLSQYDTTGGRLIYNILYTGVKTSGNERYIATHAVRPINNNNWPFSENTYFTNGKVGLGSQQIINAGSGDVISVTTGTGIPNTGIYRKGDIIIMKDPASAGYDHYRCTVGGDAALGTAVFVPVGAISATGALVYRNSVFQSGGNFYIGDFKDSGGLNKVASAPFPPGGLYFTKGVNDTGIVAFKTPWNFSITGDVVVKGTMFTNNKGNADFTVTTRFQGNKTVAGSTLTFKGDSSLIGTKVRWLSDADNATYLAFFDVDYILRDKSVIRLESITLTGATDATMNNATMTWTPSILKSLTGFTTLATPNNNNAVDWVRGVTSKPTIPAQFNPIAGTNMTITGTYPNLTFNSTATGGGTYTDAQARAAISLTTTGTSGAATYNSTTGVLNIPQYTGGTGGTNLNGSGFVKMNGTTPSYVAQITNADLQNNTITINGTAVALGGSINIATGGGTGTDTTTCGMDGTIPVATGPIPTVTPATGGVTVTVDGANAAMVLEVTIAPGTTINGTLCTINYNAVWGGRPVVSITPGGASAAFAASQGGTVGASTTLTNTINVVAFGLGAGTYTYNLISILPESRKF